VAGASPSSRPSATPSRRPPSALLRSMPPSLSAARTPSPVARAPSHDGASASRSGDDGDDDATVAYAQGLIFNAAFHFGQLLVRHGVEVRGAPALHVFAQFFTATLLNLLATEFHDVRSHAGAGGSAGGGGGAAATGSTRETLFAASGADDKTLEQSANELCVAWFFGEQARTALASVFGGRAAVSISATWAPAPAAGDASASPAPHKAGASSMVAGGSASGAVSPGGFSIPPRHQLDTFVRASRAVDAALPGGALAAPDAAQALPLKYNSRRMHELIASRGLGRRRAGGDGGANALAGDGRGEDVGGGGAAPAEWARAGAAADVTANLEVLTYRLQRGELTPEAEAAERVATAARLRAHALASAAERQRDSCRRLDVVAVSVDEVSSRGGPFALGAQSQLLELGAVLAHHHVTSAASHEAAAPTMTNAFTPRPEASMQLGGREAARMAGFDTARRRLRCPFCHPHPHALRLDVAALRLTRAADKAACRCRCCFVSRAGYMPMMRCGRCAASLCVSCVQVVVATAVEAVLTRAASESAPRQCGDIVARLWGPAIAEAVFGPLAPPPPPPLLGDDAQCATPLGGHAALADLGAALLATRPRSSLPRGASASSTRSIPRASAASTPGAARPHGGSESADTSARAPASSAASSGRRLAAPVVVAPRAVGLSAGSVIARALTPLPELAGADSELDASRGGARSPPPPPPTPSPAVFQLTQTDDSRVASTGSGSAAGRAAGATPTPLRLPRHLHGRVMRCGMRVDPEIFASGDARAEHAASLAAGWRSRHVVHVTPTPDATRGNIGRLRAHIARSLAHAREALENAAADAERERAEAVIAARRSREASSRAAVLRLRGEAGADAARRGGGASGTPQSTGDGGSGSSTAPLPGEVPGDAALRRRRDLAAAVDAYASRFAPGAASAALVGGDARTAADAQRELAKLAANPALALVSRDARSRVTDFIARERSLCRKAAAAATRVRDLVAWSESMGADPRALVADASSESAPDASPSSSDGDNADNIFTLSL
jgi:hypothetical protein